ncbi:hypothetical protein GCM10011371_02030 [Novosphingobium marinum]|uniref:Uncharacterized protein n=1 Tax=Novosphingobium marinum TaxID=1514948 RepID=A0A7Y9XSU3_9SPHN|nr:hypothetical protein [Novosphingobium marinum]NYH93895.1 hypothetical protein [Novosphingobium marinum]GGC18093.1 hypothetical protein GCM10011371_02030 [Novosphingobium marinum]
MSDYIPPDFGSVPFGSIEQAECAPQVTPNFNGVVIRVPEQIHIEDGEAVILPICGYYQLPTAVVLDGERMAVHVRSISRPDVPPMSGPVVLQDGDNEPLAPPPEPPPMKRSNLAGRVSDAYFYVDAQKMVSRQLPPGIYDVCVTYAGQQSNVARVEVTGPG